jgi:drug/metabolite transporter (DMT)-like permease
MGISFGASSNVPAFKPLLYLVFAVLLLSSITPTIKYVLQHSELHPVGMAGLRVLIGFLFLLLITLQWDRTGVRVLAGRDTVRVVLLGLLGVVSYAISAWGLLYTSVTHYILIYSLVPSFTAVFSLLWGTEQIRLFKVLGILISLLGCVIAISEGIQEAGISVGIGDGLVLLFTMMMAAYMVLSAGIANHLRALPVNTLMFGSSSLILSLLVVSLGAMGWPGPPLERITPLIIVLAVYVGIATAMVFLLRYLSIRSLTPSPLGCTTIWCRCARSCSPICVWVKRRGAIPSWGA